VPLCSPGVGLHLGSVDTAEATTASAHGHITMFIREDEPFRPKRPHHRRCAPFRRLDRLLAEREARHRDTEHRMALPV
jgi:hypothetical protein